MKFDASALDKALVDPTTTTTRNYDVDVDDDDVVGDQPISPIKYNPPITPVNDFSTHLLLDDLPSAVRSSSPRPFYCNSNGNSYKVFDLAKELFADSNVDDDGDVDDLGAGAGGDWHNHLRRRMDDELGDDDEDDGGGVDDDGDVDAALAEHRRRRLEQTENRRRMSPRLNHGAASPGTNGCYWYVDDNGRYCYSKATNMAGNLASNNNAGNNNNNNNNNAPKAITAGNNSTARALVNNHHRSFINNNNNSSGNNNNNNNNNNEIERWNRSDNNNISWPAPVPPSTTTMTTTSPGRSSSSTRLECKVCQLVFKTLDDLRAHHADHADENLFMCTTCSYTCKQAFRFQKHQLTHTEVYVRDTLFFE